MGSSARRTRGSLLRAQATRPAGAGRRTALPGGSRPGRRARPGPAARWPGRAARGASPASSAGSSTFSSAVSSSIRWKPGTRSRPVRRRRARARSLMRSMRRPPARPPHRGPVRPAQEVQQGGLPAAAGAHHRHRLPGGDIEVDPVDGAHQRLSTAVLLAQPAGPRTPDPSAVSLTIRSFARSSRSHASSHAGRPAAAARCPPAAAPPRAVGLGHGGALGVAQPAQQLAALGVDDAERVGQPGGGRRHQLEVELGQVGLGPAHLGEPLTRAPSPRR